MNDDKINSIDAISGSLAVIVSAVALAIRKASVTIFAHHCTGTVPTSDLSCCIYNIPSYHHGITAQNLPHEASIGACRFGMLMIFLHKQFLNIQKLMSRMKFIIKKLIMYLIKKFMVRMLLGNMEYSHMTSTCCNVL